MLVGWHLKIPLQKQLLIVFKCMHAKALDYIYHCVRLHKRHWHCWWLASMALGLLLLIATHGHWGLPSPLLISPHWWWLPIATDGLSLLMAALHQWWLPIFIGLILTSGSSLSSSVASLRYCCCPTWSTLHSPTYSSWIPVILTGISGISGIWWTFFCM